VVCVTIRLVAEVVACGFTGSFTTNIPFLKYLSFFCDNRWGLIRRTSTNLKFKIDFFRHDTMTGGADTPIRRPIAARPDRNDSDVSAAIPIDGAHALQARLLLLITEPIDASSMSSPQDARALLTWTAESLLAAFLLVSVPYVRALAPATTQVSPKASRKVTGELTYIPSPTSMHAVASRTRFLIATATAGGTG
jgi:hypothetical protein